MLRLDTATLMKVLKLGAKIKKLLGSADATPARGTRGGGHPAELLGP